MQRVLEIAGAWPRPVPRRSASATRPGWRTRSRCASSSPRRRRTCPGVELTAHFHNTRGQGLANVLAALEAGVESFESSFGELGGCPVPAGATGNIASEDLVSMLEEMGIGTGIDLAAADRGLPRCSGSARPAARQPRPDRRAGRLAICVRGECCAFAREFGLAAQLAVVEGGECCAFAGEGRA